MSEQSPEQSDSTALALAGEFPLWNPDDDFRKLALDSAYISQGFRLIDKEDLSGIPFVVKRVVFREGFPRDGVEGDYVSLECIVADKQTMDSEPVVTMMRNAENYPARVYGNEAVVFNDSGTGIRREIVKHLHEWGIIDVGQDDPEHPELNKYDRPMQMWASGMGVAEGGVRAEMIGKAGLYLALRGLRISEYDWHGQEAHTWYFA